MRLLCLNKYWREIFKKYLKCYAVTGQYDSDLDISCLVLVNTLRKNLCTNLKKTLLKKHEITKLQSTVNNLPTYFYANNNLYRYLSSREHNFPSKISI